MAQRVQRTRRRENGQGAISYDAHAGCWIGLLDVARDEGRRVRTKVRGRTRAEVRDKLDALRVQREAGIDIGARTLTVGQLIDLWFERGAPVDVTENTIYNYQKILLGHVAPAIGEVRVSELKASDVEKMLDDMAGRGMSASSLRHALNLTRRVLKFAVRRDLAMRNVADAVLTPRGPKAERYGLSVKQAKRLLEVAASDRLGNLLTLSLLLGLRPGEAAGLTWEHVKTKGKRPSITVATSLRRTPLGALVLVPPKTPTSRRTLEIPPPVVSALKAQRRQQKTEREIAGRAWQNTYDLVFTTELGTPLDPSNVRRTYMRLARSAGLEHLHPHMLRHAAASLLSAAGVPIEDIADTLGHRSVNVTAEIYRHPIAPIRSGHMAAMHQLATRPERSGS
ncbi:tyrosine-type recombinase/integrase [Cellulomonas fimi]|uniref:Site-specific integrase n=1 Tax=Cellulomonas fimi TaxID=1708 RepID=A0A7Y0QIF6_CELFI|nr:tyrosine-type recombinase/integrase [Cellulomonas fimi]NMR21153.1 site-specific integrase [Cellulomonas fimi]